MSENWTREDMVRMMGSEEGADMAKLASDWGHRASVLEAAIRKHRDEPVYVEGPGDDGEGMVLARNVERDYRLYRVLEENGEEA